MEGGWRGGLLDSAYRYTYAYTRTLDNTYSLVTTVDDTDTISVSCGLSDTNIYVSNEYMDHVVIENDIGCIVRPVSLRDDEEMYQMSTEVPTLYSSSSLTKVATDTLEIRVLCQLAL